MILVNLKYIEEKEKIYCYTVKMMLCVHDRLSKKEKKTAFSSASNHTSQNISYFI